LEKGGENRKREGKPVGEKQRYTQRSKGIDTTTNASLWEKTGSKRFPKVPRTWVFCGEKGDLGLKRRKKTRGQVIPI